MWFLFQLQVLDPKNKGPPTCKCSDCLKKQKTSSISQSQSKVELAFPVKKTSTQQAIIKSSTSEVKMKFSTSQSKQSDTTCKQLPQEDSSDTCESCKVKKLYISCRFFIILYKCSFHKNKIQILFFSRSKESKKVDEGQWHVYDKNCKDSMTNELVDAWITKPSTSKYTMWIEMKKRFEIERKNHSSSEQSSQDCGYFSGHNISSSSLPSTPEGSEVACNDGCCNHEGACQDKFDHSSPNIFLLQEGGLTLSQMLKVKIYTCVL